jgi:Na+-driven multidrug efflux pump
MTTIINTPPGTTEDSSTGLIIGIIFGVLIVVLFLVFGVPYLRNRTAPPQTQTVPNGDTTINVTVPSVAPVTPTNTPSKTP